MFKNNREKNGVTSLNININQLRLFVFVLNLLITGFITYNYIMLKVQTIQCRAKIQLFEQIVKDSSVEKNPRAVLASYEYIKTYYPSGILQERGSDLDMIVEIARHNSMQKLKEYYQVLQLR